jgi:hypothetical protein
MLRTSNGYLDFDEDIELERQSLLFEELSETRGDFSYSFSIPWTKNNIDILGIPIADNLSKIVYQRIDTDLMSESGSVLHRGFLRIEGITPNREIRCSFFSGNTNWLSLLTGDMTELNLTAYDRDITESEIEASWTEDDGIVFPVFDAGQLIDRSFPNILPQDFVGSFYLHTLFNEVFKQSGIKLQGELMNDPLYRKMVIVTNTRSKIDVDANSIYVAKSSQVVGPGDVAGVTFDLQSNPYFIGDDVAFTLNTTYTAPVDMLIDASATFESSDPLIFILRINNNVGKPSVGKISSNGSISIENFLLRAGDTVHLTATNLGGTSITINSGTLKIVPKFIYRAYGRSGVPLWSKIDFINNVLALFNTVTDYDLHTKTLTINLFDKIKSKTPIDLSSYVNVSDVDYSEFISNYGQRSLLTYSEGFDEEIQSYNISSFIKYGAGVLEVDNEFLPPSETILESDFSAPISYINPVFDSSMEKISFVEYEEVDNVSITSVTDDAGIAKFNHSTDDNGLFSEYDVVLIESSVPEYNGTYIVGEVGSGYIKVQGLDFDSDAEGTITKLIHKFTNDDSVYLMVHTKSINVDQLSPTLTGWYFQTTFQSGWSVGFFNLLNNGTAINDTFKQGLSFGEVTDPLFYQRTLKETYWGTSERVLNDPIKLTIIAHLPEVIYNQLTPLAPVYLKTEETVNLYYVNKVSGYVSSFKPCEIELIKLP